jgi:hypothetical protein
MILLAAFAISVIIVPVCGGRLQRLADVSLRHAWMLPGALVLQLLATTIVPSAGEGLLTAVHLLSYVLAALFLLSNIRLPGLWVLTLGAGFNAIAIVANGGVMPARAAAMEAAGIPMPSPGEFANSQALPHPRLSFLGDVFAWPRPLPLSNVFSIGDVLIVAGAAIAIHRISGSHVWRRLRRDTSARDPQRAQQ